MCACCSNWHCWCFVTGNGHCSEPPCGRFTRCRQRQSPTWRGRADLLGAAAVLGGLLIYIRSIDLVGRRKTIWLAGLFVVALAGVFSKENAAVLIALMVLWDVAFGWVKRPGWKPRQAAYLLMGAVLCILMVARWKVFEGEPWPETPFLDNPIRNAGLFQGRLTAISVIGRYLGLMVWPARLSSDYAYNQIPVARFSDIGPWLVLLLAGGILATVIARYRTDRTLFWATGFFAIALLPTANLIFPIGAIMALRFLYLPSAGFAIALAAVALRLNRPVVMRVLIGIAIVALAARTLARIPAWQDNGALGAADVITAPGSFRTHQVLAQALYAQDPKGNLDRAIREYEITYHVIEGVPPEDTCSQCLSELGMFYYGKANATGGASTPEGHAWFEKALTMLEKARTASVARAREFENTQIAHGLASPLTHDDPNLDLYLARTYAHLGRPDEALQTYRELQWQDPAQRELYDEMATIYATKGLLEQAAIIIDEKAFVLGINNATAASLRNLYARIPDGACALKGEGGSTELNLDCPRVRADMCQGWAELDVAFRAVRQSQRANTIRASAIQRYGCPAESFRTGQ